MAQHKSAAKRARQSVKKSTVNTARKSKVRTSEKSVMAALKNKDIKELASLLSQFTSEMMKAAQKGVFSRSTASRKIARVSSQVHKATTSAK